MIGNLIHRAALAVVVAVGKRRMLIEHAYSHYAVRLHVFECRYVSGKPRTMGCQRFRWAKPDELEKLAFPNANKRIIAELIAEAKKSAK